VASKRITLADVAREAGVSVQTASHVMSENMTVRLPMTTRARVKEAAEKVGYRPNRLAQAMKSGRSQVVGVWLPVDRLIIPYMRFLKAVSAKARQEGYELMITALEGSTAYGDAGKAPPLWPVDGIMAFDAGKAIESFRKDATNDMVPVCILGFEECVNGDTVAWNVAGAAKEATQKLIAKGCKNVVHITLDWVLENYPREQRRRGYTEAMNEAGLQPVFVAAEDETSSAAARAMDAYLNQNPPPDGVFAFTDGLAIGAARALYLRGFDVPRDTLIFGFSDLPEAEDYRVPISSVRAPIEELVDQGWQWLIERIATPETPSRITMLPMKMIERESTERR
jgi:DNA-binding LacI/PurR family transcriptional regulator